MKKFRRIVAIILIFAITTGYTRAVPIDYGRVNENEKVKENGMEKIHNNLNWVNNSTPAINAQNLNYMDNCIDILDNRVVSLNLDIDKSQPIRDVSMHKNLMFTPQENIDKSISHSTGQLNPTTGSNVTAYFKAIQGKTLYFSKMGKPSPHNSYDFYHLARYDSGLNYLGIVVLGSSSSDNITYTVQSNDAWYRVDYAKSHPNLQIEYDNVTAYHAYSGFDNPDEIEFAKQMTESLTGSSKYILKSTGEPLYNSGFPSRLFVTEMLRLDLFKGATIKNADSWVLANGYPVAFYDYNRKVIGTAYTPSSVTTEVSVDIVLSDALLDNYRDAVYFRVGGNTEYGTRIIPKDSSKGNVYPTYKVNAYPNIFFGGDSVTQGFVVEGTIDNPSSTYEEMPEYSYPASFNRIYPGANVTKIAQTGISAYGYYYNKYPNIDFSQYQLIVIELGLNGSDHGYIDIADINTVDTNTWCLKKLIEGIRSQNSEAQIALVRSQYFVAGDSRLQAFQTICEAYDALFVDLHNTDYLNLADPQYHGYFNDSGTARMDYAHFTRRGYSAKAYVVACLLGDLLPD